MPDIERQSRRVAASKDQAASTRLARPRSTRTSAATPSRVNVDTRSTLIASLAIVSVVAIALFIWAFRMQGELNDTRADLATVTTERDTLRMNANATAYRLTPTKDAPANASGVAYIDVQGSGVLTTANLPRLGTNQIYQVWFQSGTAAAPVPGGTFAPTANGSGFILISRDVGTYKTIFVTVEPASGSKTPTTPALLTVDLSGLRG